MLSFLAQKDRRRVKAEYFLRVLCIILLMSMLLAIHSVCLILPSYLLAKENNKTVTSYAKAVLGGSKDKIDPTTIVKELNEMIGAMRPYDKILLPSEAIESVLLYNASGLHLNGFMYEIGNADTVKFTLKGNAKTRDALLGLVKGIRSGSMFDTVDLPVSGFAKSSDIDFSINLTPRK